MDDTSKYRDLFFEESDEYIQTLNDCLLNLEKNPEDSCLIDEIFRAAHTLKGMAATMGYKTMTDLTHSMENVFTLFKNKSITISSDAMSLLFLCLDKLLEIVEDLRIEKYVEYDIRDLIQRLDNLDKNSTDPKEEVSNNNLTNDISDTDLMIINNAHENGYNAYTIEVKLFDSCLLKGARAYLVVNKLEQQGDIIHSDPSSERLEAGEFDFRFKLIYLTKLDKDSVNEIVESIAEIEKVIIFEVDQKLTITESKNELLDEIKETQPKGDQSNHNHGNQSIRVDISRLDSFMNLVSELVIYRTRLEDINSRNGTLEIKEPLEQVARITSELQDLVLKIRMQPVNVVLNRFPRMIRDLAKELDKELELIIEGEDTELDRTVISELGEPLVHLLRNAADHGIESKQNRLASGKSKVGLIKISAYQEGNRVVINVSDDGKGIKPENLGLIFNQGFSTVEKVTNISGRGVGMDVVKQKISSLGGTIDVISEIGKGTTFVIKLPLTLSIIQALMVKVGEMTMALPLSIIDNVVNISPKEIISSHSEEIYIYREKAIPVVRLDKKLSLVSTDDNKHLVIVLLGTQYYGLLVDDLVGQQEIVIKKLSGILGKMKEYLGATILGNGDIILILDAGNLCKERKGDDIE